MDRSSGILAIRRFRCPHCTLPDLRACVRAGARTSAIPAEAEGAAAGRDQQLLHCDVQLCHTVLLPHVVPHGAAG